MSSFARHISWSDSISDSGTDLPAAAVLVLLCLSHASPLCPSSPFFLLSENFTDATGLGNGE